MNTPYITLLVLFIEVFTNIQFHDSKSIVNGYLAAKYILAMAVLISCNNLKSLNFVTLHAAISISEFE
jgi:hypothetical protein